jgi:hypothetical protein
MTSWQCVIISANKTVLVWYKSLVRFSIVLLLILPVEVSASPGALLYTEAPEYAARPGLRARDRFPAGAAVRIFANGVSRPLAPSLAISADPALSPDARSVLLSGKQDQVQPWHIWEIPLTGGPPRQLTFGADDCIRPFYASAGKFVYARQTPQGSRIEIAPLDGGKSLQLTWLPGAFLPDGVMRDGRVLFEAVFPGSASMARELYTVYTDGSGVESRRCDHGPDRRSAVELASGDLVFQSGDGWARFTSARAGQLELQLPKGEYAGPVAETETGEWLAAYRANPGAPYWICRFPPRPAAQPLKVVGPNAFQPVPVRVRPAPPYHPSSLGNREGANLLCLNAYTSKSQRIPENSVAEVRVWSRTAQGDAVLLGNAPVEPDGSFYVQVPSEKPLRFELVGRNGATVAAEKSWFWARKGEQRVCVGCHAGPERAPENAVPQVLLRTQNPVSMRKPVD